MAVAKGKRRKNFAINPGSRDQQDLRISYIRELPDDELPSTEILVSFLLAGFTQGRRRHKSVLFFFILEVYGSAFSGISYAQTKLDVSEQCGV
jgi:hypothetical protein